MFTKSFVFHHCCLICLSVYMYWCRKQFSVFAFFNIYTSADYVQYKIKTSFYGYHSLCDDYELVLQLLVLFCLSALTLKNEFVTFGTKPHLPVLGTLNSDCLPFTITISTQYNCPFLFPPGCNCFISPLLTRVVYTSTV